METDSGEHHLQINQCKVVKVVSSVPIRTEDKAYRVIANFLEKDKLKLMDPKNELESEDPMLIQRTAWNRLRGVAHEIPVTGGGEREWIEPWIVNVDGGYEQENAGDEDEDNGAKSVDIDEMDHQHKDQDHGGKGSTKKKRLKKEDNGEEAEDLRREKKQAKKEAKKAKKEKKPKKQKGL